MVHQSSSVFGKEEILENINSLLSYWLGTSVHKKRPQEEKNAPGQLCLRPLYSLPRRDMLTPVLYMRI